MKANDQVTPEYIQELEADNDNFQIDNDSLRIDNQEQAEEIKSLRLELQLMFRDRCYVA
jgi:hypothetical protein